MVLMFLQGTVGGPLLGYAEYGVLGLTILGLGAAVVKLYTDNGKLRDKADTVFRENAATLTTLSATIKEATTAQCAAIARLAEQLELAKRLEALERRKAE